MASKPEHLIDERAEPRDEVMYRTRVTLIDRRQFPVTVVNISPNGMMLRGDATISAGEWMKVRLPDLGEVEAAVRWSLGGRIGCQLDRPIAARDYPALLFALRR